MIALLSSVIDSGKFQNLVSIWLVVLSLVLANLLKTIVDSQVHHITQFKQLWPYLELEEGRECGGAVALMFFATTLAFSHKQNNIMILFGLMVILFIAFIWWQYQHEMTAKYRQSVSHCDGAFD